MRCVDIRCIYGDNSVGVNICVSQCSADFFHFGDFAVADFYAVGVKYRQKGIFR